MHISFFLLKKIYLLSILRDLIIIFDNYLISYLKMLKFMLIWDKICVHCFRETDCARTMNVQSRFYADRC